MREFEVQNRRKYCTSSPRPSPPFGEEREKNGAVVELCPNVDQMKKLPRFSKPLELRCKRQEGGSVTVQRLVAAGNV